MLANHVSQCARICAIACLGACVRAYSCCEHTAYSATYAHTHEPKLFF